MAQIKNLSSTNLAKLWSNVKANFVAKEAGKGLSANDLTDELVAKIEASQANVIETVKVNGEALEVTDKAVNVEVPTGALASKDEVAESDLVEELAAKINGKANAATTLAGYGITDAMTATEIETAINTAVTAVYKVKGSIAFAELPVEGMVAGDTYNITDEFTTNASFKEGAGHVYPAGTNVVYDTEGKWDCMGGIYDLSVFVKSADIVDMTDEEIDAICVMD